MMLTDKSFADILAVIEAIDRLDIQKLVTTRDRLCNVIVLHMVEWFQQNYEDPVESQPVDSGDFVWLVSKCDAREELDENFPNVPEDLIEKAVDQIEEDGTTEWVSIREMNESFTR
jgi:hypothetical protein